MKRKNQTRDPFEAARWFKALFDGNFEIGIVREYERQLLLSMCDELLRRKKASGKAVQGKAGE